MDIEKLFTTEYENHIIFGNNNLKYSRSSLVPRGTSISWIAYKNLLNQQATTEIVELLEPRINEAKANVPICSSKSSARLDMRHGDKYGLCGDELLIKLTKTVYYMAKNLLIKYDAPCDPLLKDRELFTSLGLLYGPNSSMLPHVDSPTFPGNKHEWLVCFTQGLSVKFRVGTHELLLESGDALIMDAMALMHGVIEVLPRTAPPWHPLQNARLGILLWENKLSANKKDTPSLVNDAANSSYSGSRGGHVENIGHYLFDNEDDTTSCSESSHYSDDEITL